MKNFFYTTTKIVHFDRKVSYVSLRFARQTSYLHLTETMLFTSTTYLFVNMTENRSSN